MKSWQLKTAILVLVAATALVLWLNRPGPGVPTSGGPPQPATRPGPPLRIGLVPEHDVFALRRSYKVLADYLTMRLDRPVELLTMNSYEVVLEDLREQRIEGAFLGSLVALVAMEHLGARVLLKPQSPDGISTYRGVIFVRGDSPFQDLDALRGRSIAMIRTTLAGCLFPLSEMVKRNMTGAAAPRILWVGTHDDAVEAVVSGQADFGAAKDLRLDAYERAHPQVKLKRLAVSPSVPNNALLLRGEVWDELAGPLAAVLESMHSDPAAAGALEALGAARFVRCEPHEYSVIRDMADAIGSALDTGGPGCGLLRRPAAQQSEPSGAPPPGGATRQAGSAGASPSRGSGEAAP